MLALRSSGVAKLGFALAVTLMGVLVASPAAGDDRGTVVTHGEIEGTPVTTLTSGADSTRTGEGVTPQAIGLELSPAGCTGITDYPHASNGVVATTFGPYASVHGRTKCNRNVEYVSARSEVWRKVWHGHQKLYTGKLASRSNARNSPDSTPHYYCGGQGTSWYVGYTNHTSIEGGKTYSARTKQEGTKAKSEFECRKVS